MSDPGGEERATILEGLGRAIAGGLPPSRAVTWLNAKISGDAYFPEKIHAKVVSSLPAPKAKDTEVWLRELCLGCDDNGVTENENFAVRSGSQVCLHGQPRPEPTARGMKKCSTCPRQIPARAADRCGRCAGASKPENYT